MADWSTIIIAAITAGAALGGGYVTGRYNLRLQDKSHRRDDEILLREKVEELFNELDRISALANQQAVVAMTGIHNKAAPEMQMEAINSGRVRSLVNLYFPQLATELTAYDDETTDGIKTFSANMEEAVEKGEYILETGLGHHVLELHRLIKLCADLREGLAKCAKEIGAPIANS